MNTAAAIGLIGGLLRVIRLLFDIYSMLIIINALLSWIPGLNNSLVGVWIARLVNPYLNLFRRGPFLKLAYSTGIDFSPILALLVLYFVEDIVINRWLVGILARLVS